MPTAPFFAHVERDSSAEPEFSPPPCRPTTSGAFFPAVAT
jgi:hypothetical protein